MDVVDAIEKVDDRQRPSARRGAHRVDLSDVSADERPDETEITCPHCKQTFHADLIEGAAERYRGFKCPHCRLFVPAERS